MLQNKEIMLQNKEKRDQNLNHKIKFEDNKLKSDGAYLATILSSIGWFGFEQKNIYHNHNRGKNNLKEKGFWSAVGRGVSARLGHYLQK